MDRLVCFDALLLIIAAYLIQYQVTASQIDISITVDSTDDIIGCQNINGTSYKCSSLQDALEMLNSTSSSQESPILFNIELESNRVHYITRPILTNASVHIVSSTDPNGVMAVVTCRYVADSSYGFHTIYFDQSPSVVFAGIEFHSCPLPIRMFQVNNITVEYSSFRYVPYTQCMLRFSEDTK